MFYYHSRLMVMKIAKSLGTQASSLPLGSQASYLREIGHHPATFAQAGSLRSQGLAILLHSWSGFYRLRITEFSPLKT